MKPTLIPEQNSVVAAPTIKGLDLGTDRIVLAELHDDGVRYPSQRNGFVSLPYAEVVVRMLREEGILHWVEETQILAFGNGIEEVAAFASCPVRRPMQHGLLNPTEPRSVQVVDFALRQICGEADGKENLYFTLPAAGEMGTEWTYTERTVYEVLERLGYRPRPLNKALAVVYAELEHTNFTGLAISLGAGTCDVCLAYLSVPLMTFSTPEAGDYIDQSCALVSGKTSAAARAYKEGEFRLNGLSSDNTNHALSIFYRAMIGAIVDRLEKEFATTHRWSHLRNPIPIVLSGGSALAGGFRAEFVKAIEHVVLPFEVSEVRRAEDPLNATAKGALRAATPDLQTRRDSDRRFPTTVSSRMARPTMNSRQVGILLSLLILTLVGLITFTYQARSTAAVSRVDRTGPARVAGLRGKPRGSPPVVAAPAPETPQKADLVGSTFAPAEVQASPVRLVSSVYLQVGAFQDPEAAQTLAENLREKDYPAILDDQGDGWYRVLAGPFADQVAAKRCQRRLSQEGFNSFARKR